jgi:hypothetical protein
MSIEDNWTVVQRGRDDHGEWVWVERVRDTGASYRVTAWKLYRTAKGWRYFRVLFSRENAGLNGIPEREKRYDHSEGHACPCHAQGVKLTDSKLDRTLLYLCENG